MFKHHNKNPARTLQADALFLMWFFIEIRVAEGEWEIRLEMGLSVRMKKQIN